MSEYVYKTILIMDGSQYYLGIFSWMGAEKFSNDNTSHRNPFNAYSFILRGGLDQELFKDPLPVS